jgi:ferredoxin
MATMITSECINCGACEPECPNTAIYQGGVEWELNGKMNPPISDGIFYIVPEKCTECVGFYDHEACAAVCPVDCCVPNPDIPESEAVLIARAKQLHPETTFGDDFPSRFRTDGAEAPAPQGNGHAEPAPVAAPATAAKPAAAAAKLAPAAAKAAPAIKAVPAAKTASAKGEKIFPGELGISFEAALARVKPQQSKPVLGALVSVAQPILGALPLSTKQALQDAVGDRRYFSVATSTGLNVVLNMILYPAVLVAIYVTVMGGELFSQGINKMAFLGIFIASLETMLRLRESFFAGVPSDEATYRGTFYGLPLAPLVSPFLGSAAKSRPVEKGQTAFEGYYTSEFDEKTERARRYGEVFTIEDMGNAYFLRLEMPRRVPVSAAKREMGIGDDMPDYEYDLAIRNGSFIVKGKLTDPQIRKLAAISPAFPPDFTRQIECKSPVASFKHRYRNKTLEAILFKR